MEQQKDVLVERLKAYALRVSVLSREPSQDEGGAVACLRAVSPAVCVVRVEWFSLIAKLNYKKKNLEYFLFWVF